MSIFIQSANALVSRVAQWVGALPQTLTITATAVNTTTGVITTSADPTAQVQVGDFIGNSVFKPYAAVTAVSSTTITVSDPDATWAGLTLPSVIYKFPTQSTVEILQCIQQAELKMRTIELPALRSNPYGSSPDVLTTNSDGMAPIPTDMNKPIFFFQESPGGTYDPNAAGFGPWIVYDRVGDREIIRRRMIDQLYVRPFGVPRVIRASFSEVGPNYVFTPNPGANTTIKAYYQRTFPFLFSPTSDNLNPIVQNNAALASFPEGYFIRHFVVVL